MKKILTLLILLQSILNYSTVIAKEIKVVVSIPPLHSLVSSLMKGAGQPTLLYDGEVDQTATLDPFQKGHLITSDMMVWVGSGMESSLEQTLNELPVLRGRSLTLSKYLPLHPRSINDDNENNYISRQQSRDLAFWTDTRLAVMAVRMITPKLVRLDPDNQELYLENEITLIKNLKNLEAEITAELSHYSGYPEVSIVSSDVYFTHRFIANNVKLSDKGYSFRKVSVSNDADCRGDFIQKEKLSTGPTLYFDAMRLKVHTIKACLNKAKDSSNQSI